MKFSSVKITIRNNFKLITTIIKNVNIIACININLQNCIKTIA
jgi:hypothetical protein